MKVNSWQLKVNSDRLFGISAGMSLYTVNC